MINFQLHLSEYRYNPFSHCQQVGVNCVQLIYCTIVLERDTFSSSFPSSWPVHVSTVELLLDQDSRGPARGVPGGGLILTSGQVGSFLYLASLRSLSSLMCLVVNCGEGSNGSGSGECQGLSFHVKQQVVTYNVSLFGKYFLFIKITIRPETWSSFHPMWRNAALK